jgi:tetratricopeptide (TPR) repeat protein
MRWRRRLYIFFLEIISAVLAAVAATLTNVITNEDHPKTVVVVSLITFVLSSGVLQGLRSVRADKKERHADSVLENIEEAAREILNSSQEAEQGRAEANLDAALAHFPEIFRSWIKEQWRKSPEEVIRVLDALNESTPRPSAVVLEWQQHLPGWISGLGWRALLVAGELANAYGAAQLSVDLFLAAIAAGSDREQYWRARAALLLAFQGHVDAATRILADGGINADSPDQFVRIVLHLVEANEQAALTLINVWEPEAPIDIVLTATMQVSLIFENVNDVSRASPGQFARAPTIYRNAIRAVPYTASIRISLASVLITTAAAGASTDRHRDLQEALAVALQARDLCRANRSSSVQAVEFACQAAWSDMLPSRVIEIGTAVTGDATLEEANSDIVRTLVASAALAKGYTHIGDRLIPEIVDPFQKAFLLAMSAEVAGNSSADLWRSALNNAHDHSERVRALLGMARLGITELPGIEDVRASSSHDATVIEAVAIAATGSVASAIQKLRSIPGSDLNAMMTLADVYIAGGNIPAAVDVFRESSRIMNEPRFRVEAARLLWQDGRLNDARVELEALLVDSGNNADLRHDCPILLGQWASDQAEWIRAQERYLELLALDPSDNQVRWAVILVMLRRGLFPQARVIYDSAPAEVPIDLPDQARAWMATRTNSDRINYAEFVEEVIRVAQRFPDDENVQAEAIFTVLYPDGVERDPLPPSTQAQFNQLCDRFFAAWPDSVRLRRFTADDIQGLVSQMEELIRPSKEEKTLRAEVAERLAQNTLPWAFLSAMTGRSYSEIVILRAGGVLPAQHIDGAEQQMCREAAQAALDSSVTLDISSAAVIAGLPDLSGLLIGQFERLVTSDGARLDAVRGKEALRSRSASFWTYDEENERGHLINISQELANDNFDKSTQLLDIANGCRIASVAVDPSLNELRGLATSSWATVVQCAAQSGTAFWCDDVALRAVARSIGVAAFSTPSLLEVLVERSVITAVQYESAVKALIRGVVGDFALNQVRLSALMDESSDAANAVASIFSRASTWADVNNAYRIWTGLLSKMATLDSRRVADWLHAAVIGITRLQKAASIRKEAAALLLGAAATLVSTSTGEVARCVAAARSGLMPVQQEEEDEDPLSRSVQMILATMKQQVGLANATAYVSRMFDGLEADDRLKVLQVLYG